MWECDTCEVSLPIAERESHLLGAEHWEREEMLEGLQRKQWDDIQAEKEVQAVLEMEDQERWEIEEMAREVGRIDEMCKGKEKDSGDIVDVREEGTEVQTEVGLEMPKSEGSEMDELAREVMRINEMCEEEGRVWRPSSVIEEVAGDMELGLALNVSENWEIEEIARQVRRIDEMCREKVGSVSQFSGAIGMQEAEMGRAVPDAEQRIRQVPEEGEEALRVADTNIHSQQQALGHPIGSSPRPLDPGGVPAEIDVISQLTYRAESSARGAVRGFQQNTYVNLNSHDPLQTDNLSESVANAGYQTQESIQPPLSRPW